MPTGSSTTVWRGFASDNYAGIHPEVLAAIATVNDGHQPAYGDDATTAQFNDLITAIFGDHACGFPVFNGTGANVTALQAMCQSWEAVICARSAHINADEGGAPEKVAGLKLHTILTPDGKLTPDLVANEAYDFGSVHRAQQKVVSITQSTELGTIYQPSEIAALADYAHSMGMYLHIDGARISNAAAALGCSLREMVTETGVDALSLGATKNGALAAEAVVMLNPTLAAAVPFVRKSAMQLSSKMRFTSAQLVAMFGTDLYLRNASHANAMATRLYHAVNSISGVQAGLPPQANALFPILPIEVTRRLQESYRFYVWNQFTGQVRWMCSWDTTTKDVDDFAAAVATEMA
jgi:threonine aldolase